MSGFVKLFSSIVDSTIWREDPETKVAWITMLTKADRNGYVFASIPGLADAARIPIDKLELALDKFRGPDKYSRTKDHDGRRIIDVDGGWLILNYTKYRELRSQEESRIANAERVKRYRAKHSDVTLVMDVTECNASSLDVTLGNAIAEAEAEANPEKKKKNVAHSVRLSPDDEEKIEKGLLILREIYPRKYHDGVKSPSYSPSLTRDRIRSLATSCGVVPLMVALESYYSATAGQYFKAPQNFLGPRGPWRDFLEVQS